MESNIPIFIGEGGEGAVRQLIGTFDSIFKK